MPVLEHIKAWPVALFGLVKDCWPSSPDNIFKWVILEKLLAPPPFEMEEENMIEIDDPLEEQESRSQVDKENGDTEDVDELADSEMIESEPLSQNLVPSDVDELATDNEASPVKVAPPPKTKVPKVKSKKRPHTKKKLEQGMLFEDLCYRMELGFWNLTADERVELLDFIVDELVLDSKLITTFRDASLERFTDLKKEQREIVRHRKAIAQSILELTKALEGSTAPQTVPLFDAPIEVGGESDGSDNEFDDL